MARYNDTIETTPAAIRMFAENLRTISTSFDQQADFMEKTGLTSLNVKNWKSAKIAVSSFASFAAAIQDAIIQTKVSDGLDQMITKPEVSPDKSKVKVKRTNNPS
jgi:hypothetical protein